MSKMDKDILESITKSLDSTKIDMISPEPDILNKVLTLQSTQIQVLTEYDITRYIYVLAQYQIFLQVQCNVRNIRYLDSKRRYEFQLARELSNFEGKTVKERTSTALLNSPDLQDLEKEMKIKEADYLLFDKIPDAIAEMSNALKKELSIRLPNNYNKPRAI
jgi:hypothetical protein